MANYGKSFLKHGAEFALSVGMIKAGKEMERLQKEKKERIKMNKENEKLEQEYVTEYVLYKPALDMINENISDLLEFIVENEMNISKELMDKTKHVLGMLDWVQTEEAALENGN